MSTAFIFRILFVSCMSLAIAYNVFSRYDSEIGTENNSDDDQRYAPYISGSILPSVIIFLTIAMLLFYGTKTAIQTSFSMYFGVFLHISVYYMILMILLPFLRKQISARACAVLWMVPNYLYVLQHEFMNLSHPLLVFRAPEKLVWSFIYIWLTGFVLVFAWKLVSHLHFRQQILSDSVPVTDPRTLNLWNDEVKRANIKKAKFRLVVSPNVSTPLSVGLFRRTTRVVLPERYYAEDELSLIFRHEIVHIQREDVWAKFFLMFCTAICWFNPLLWIAQRKCSDDLELSCDETVLLDSDETTRRKYAALILGTAGDERGFTTCLSASASALRYRLKNIVVPRKCRSGALIAGLSFFLLCMSCGYVALAYGELTGAEAIYQSRDTSLYNLRHITRADSTYNTIYECTDIDAFHEYMSGLTLGNITGNYTFENDERTYTFLYDTPEGTLAVALSDSILKLTPLYGENPESTTYYLPEGVDWEYLDTTIMAYPSLKFHVRSLDSPYPKEVSTSLWKLSKTEDGKPLILYECESPWETPSGAFGYDTVGATATLDFSDVPTSEFVVKVETWDRQDGYTVSQSELDEKDVLPLAPYSAHYTVYATFSRKDGVLYDAEFRFDFGDVASE